MSWRDTFSKYRFTHFGMNMKLTFYPMLWFNRISYIYQHGWETSLIRLIASNFIRYFMGISLLFYISFDEYGDNVSSPNKIHTWWKMLKIYPFETNSHKVINDGNISSPDQIHMKTVDVWWKCILQKVRNTSFNYSQIILTNLHMKQGNS